MFNVGIVGNNLYGQTFTKALTAIDGVTVRAICPELNEPLEPFAALHDLHPYPSLNAMLESEKLDAVMLGCITTHHEYNALLAIGAGLHVFVDRPIALTIDASEKMIATATAAQRVLMIGHVIQYWPEYVAIREMIKRGDLGEPRVVTASRVSGLLNPSWQERLLNPAHGLGVLEAHVHDIEFIIGLLGQPEVIAAGGHLLPNGVMNQVYSLLRFEGDCYAGIEADYSVPFNFPLTMYLRVVGEYGTVIFTFSGALSARGTAERSLTLFRDSDVPINLDVPTADAYQSMLKHFLDCAQQGREPEWGNAQQALTALEVLLKISKIATYNQSTNQ